MSAKFIDTNSVEAMLISETYIQREIYGLTKNVQMLTMICNTLKRARDEKSIEKFLMKEGLIK